MSVSYVCIYVCIYVFTFIRRCLMSSWMRISWKMHVSTWLSILRLTGRPPTPPAAPHSILCWAETSALPPWLHTLHLPSPACRWTNTVNAHIHKLILPISACHSAHVGLFLVHFGLYIGFSAQKYRFISSYWLLIILTKSSLTSFDACTSESAGSKNTARQPHRGPLDPQRTAQPDDLRRELPQRTSAQGTKQELHRLAARQRRSRPPLHGRAAGLPGPLPGHLQAAPQPQFARQLQPGLATPALSHPAPFCPPSLSHRATTPRWPLSWIVYIFHCFFFFGNISWAT